MDTVYFEQPLGDGCAISVVNSFCQALADKVPAIRFEFMVGDEKQTLEAFLVSIATKKPFYAELGRALLEIDKLAPNPVQEKSEEKGSAC